MFLYLFIFEGGTQEGICIMEIELIVGLPPQVAYEVLTNPDNQPYSRNIKKRGLLVLFF